MDLFQLALDTSTSLPTVAIMNGEKVWSSWLGPSGVRHSETLLEGIQVCLDQAQIKKHDLGFLSVGIGPGMFTGLRIGITTAKFLADALNIPCVPVSSLMALALQGSAYKGEGKIWAISDAKSQRVYILGMKDFPSDYSPPPDEELALIPKEAAALLSPEDTIIGEGAVLFAHEFAAKKLPLEQNALSAVSIGRVGAVRYRLGLTVSAVDLLPKYIKTGQPHL